jgi:8-oxo-dGTP diphosphatase
VHEYPRTACGLLVVRDDQVLLLERAQPPRVGFLDVPGGFLEAGEDPVEAARRELREETGLTVGAVEPLGTYWDTYLLRGYGRIDVLNLYWVAHWRRGAPRAADDAASAAWVPMRGVMRRRARFAWAHMTPLLRDLARWCRRSA